MPWLLIGSISLAFMIAATPFIKNFGWVDTFVWMAAALAVASIGIPDAWNDAMDFAAVMGAAIGYLVARAFKPYTDEIPIRFLLGYLGVAVLSYFSWGFFLDSLIGLFLGICCAVVLADPMNRLDRLPSGADMMSWPAIGSLPTIDMSLVGPMTPHEVLYEFEGPCIFTAYTAYRTLILAYLCEELEEEALLRFIVATTSEDTITGMKNGEVSVREALERGTLWLVVYEPLHLDHGYKPTRAFVVRVDQLPEDALPLSTTML